MDTFPQSGIQGVRRLMSERKKIVEDLVGNPNDLRAQGRLEEIDELLTKKGMASELSGKWSGHTRVGRLLTVEELQPQDARYHSWVKKDLFRNTTPVVGGVGMKLLQKMGWRPGEGLGKVNQGDTAPLVVDVKSDRKGLVSEYDSPLKSKKNKGTKGKGPKHEVAQSNEQKNPISALMELAQRKKCELPSFEFRETTQGGGMKTFTCVVTMNGEQIVGPACLNKKACKTEAAKVVLEKIGFSGTANIRTPVIYDPSSQYSLPEQVVKATVESVLHGGSTVPPPSHSYSSPPSAPSLLPPPPPPPPKPRPPPVPSRGRGGGMVRGRGPQMYGRGWEDGGHGDWNEGGYGRPAWTPTDEFHGPPRPFHPPPFPPHNHNIPYSSFPRHREHSPVYERYYGQ